MDHVLVEKRLVALGVGRVLERHPAIAGLGKGSHHAPIELASVHRLDRQAGRFGSAIRLREAVAPEVNEFGDLIGAEERPGLVGLHSAHELVRQPVGEVEVVCTPRLLTGVVAELKELVDVAVPGFEVDAGSTLALAALVHCSDRGIQRLEEWDDSARLPVGALDERASTTHT